MGNLWHRGSEDSVASAGPATKSGRPCRRTPWVVAPPKAFSAKGFRSLWRGPQKDQEALVARYIVRDRHGVLHYAPVVVCTA